MSRTVRIVVFLIWSAVITQLSASLTSIAERDNRYSSKSMSTPIRKVTGSSSASTSTIRNVSDLRAGSTASDLISDGTPSVLPAAKPSSLRKTAIKNMLAGWGVIQVLSILANAIKRLVPLAIQPIVQKDLQPTQIVICALWCAYMIYVEGYKTFQLKFSPLVVKRAFGLSNNPSIINCLFAGPYSMGLFGATRKRMIVSWSVTLGVFAIVKIVKKLPYPWRSIVDAGVVLGLSYGALSMCYQTTRAMFGYIPDVDECLPLKDKKVASE